MKTQTIISRRNAIALAGAFSLALAATPAFAENTSGVAVPSTPAFAKGDAGKYGLALAQHADRYDSGWIDQYQKGTMTLYDAGGKSVQRQIVQMTLEGSSGDKSLVRFMRPADIRGVAALIHEHPKTTDDSWLYLPASRRVRRISGANRTASFQGTEFTYEDLSSFSVERYRWKYLSDDTVNGQPVYKLEARPAYADSGYSKLVIYLHKNHFRGERAEFYDRAGRKLKTLTQSRWTHVHGRFWRPQRLDMNNHQTKKRTVLDVNALFVNLALYPNDNGAKRKNLTADRFTKHALQSG